MLLSLHIENMAVIAAMDVDFPKGLSVITGETGAGKSVMIDSLLFLLGGKPQRDLVRSGTEKATVSAVFGALTAEVRTLLSELGFDPGEELMLQRTLTADGKSQCRLDGRVITQGILREISRRLVNIHGQNDNQLLLSLPAQAKILDASAELGDLPAAYRAAYGEYSEARRALEELQKNSAEKVKELVFATLNKIVENGIDKDDIDSTLMGLEISHREIERHNGPFAKSLMIGIENGLALEDDLKNVEHFAKRGIVYITLCHNGDNQICDSARNSDRKSVV